MDEEEDEVVRVFQNAVRDYIIWLLLFMVLYVSSYAVLTAYKRKADSEDYFAGDTEDAFVYRISLWVCTFTLAVSGGAVLLLPVSIFANEVLIHYPDSYYWKWVHSSLIVGLWNIICLCSNLSLFVLIPFAYLFTESEGFPGSKKGIMSRVYETSTVLFLLTIVVFGVAWVVSAIIDNNASSKQALFDVWNFYLPYLYSCISFTGVMMLLLCTPIGFARLFTVVGEMVIKPKFLRNIEEELYIVSFEEESIKRQLNNKSYFSNISSLSDKKNSRSSLESTLKELQQDRIELERRQRISPWRRNLVYPLIMILLLALTAISVIIVSLNTLALVIGQKALPSSTEELPLGKSSLTLLGPIGAALEVTLIIYFMMASIVGFYSLPGLYNMKPKRQDTSMIKLIGNSAVLLIMSSALPVLSRTLGVTNFNLIGQFGSMKWLGNIYIILSYNVIFAGATALCLVTKFTKTIRRELINRFATVFKRDSKINVSIATNSNGGITNTALSSNGGVSTGSSSSFGNCNGRLNGSSSDNLENCNGVIRTLQSSSSSISSENLSPITTLPVNDSHGNGEIYQNGRDSLHAKTK